MQAIRKLIDLILAAPQTESSFFEIRKFKKLINKYLLKKLNIILIFGFDIIHFNYE